MDELPKDYSKVYCEADRPPLPPVRRSTSNTKPWGESDGVRTARIHRETPLDLQAVVEKLSKLPTQNQYALDSLNQQYRVSTERRKPSIYKAYINYREDKETYVVRVERNTLRTIKTKLPKRGNYRYFFKQPDNTCEEFESDDAAVPFFEKDGQKQIYCQVFTY